MNSQSNQNFKPFHFLKKNKKIILLLSSILTVVFLNLFVGCSYYNVKDIVTSPESIDEKIHDYNMAQNYVVIHSVGIPWHLNQVKLDVKNKTISGIAKALDKQHSYENQHRYRKVNQYRKSKQKPFNEVHFSVDTGDQPEIDSQVTIPFSAITRMSVNEKNSGRSFVNAIGSAVGIIVTVAIIVLLTKSSCPFVYVNNGEEFVFTGELYPGIITPNQQCDDYIPLPDLKSNNDEYCIKISNELKEIQHTDLVQLIIADHPENVEVLLDKDGIPHVFSSILSPNKVLIDNVLDDEEPALEKDDVSYLFNSDIREPSSIRHIEIEFDKPVQTDTAKLYLTLKNSMWLDYIFGKFNEQFGSHYATFQKNQQSDSREKTTKWINEQNIPLSVYVKTKKGWKIVDKINAVGPLATRDIVIPIDVGSITDNSLRIKLETGFMFWEVDYIGIDYTENAPLQLHYMNPYKAIDQDNINVTELLAQNDQKYFVQPNVGDEVVVKFKSDEIPPNLRRSLFLKNRGYYNYIRDYKGVPDFKRLYLFKEEGAFTDYSRYEYEAIMEYSNNPEIALNYEK